MSECTPFSALTNCSCVKYWYRIGDRVRSFFGREFFLLEPESIEKCELSCSRSSSFCIRLVWMILWRMSFTDPRFASEVSILFVTYPLLGLANKKLPVSAKIRGPRLMHNCPRGFWSLLEVKIIVAFHKLEFAFLRPKHFDKLVLNHPCLY